MKPIDFYFDFSSPYAYIASHLVDAIGEKHDRAIRWKPFVLGFILQKTGGRPVVDVPLKGPYLLHDIQRSASEHGVTLRLPVDFPFGAMAAVRAYYWLEAQDPGKAKTLAQALFRAAYVDNASIASPEAVAAVVETLDIAPSDLFGALQDPAVKAKVKTVTNEAFEHGVCGSPYFVVDGEGFWGQDRLAQVEQWLTRGGWPLI